MSGGPGERGFRVLSSAGFGMSELGHSGAI